MGSSYDFYLVKVDYTVKTRGGDWGTDSKVELQVLTNLYGTWDVISDKWVEPGDTSRLNAGKTESFSRTFADKVLLGNSNSDPKAYQKLVRFRFRIYGDDAWSPADIVMKPTFGRRDNNLGGFWETIQETWDYDPKNWILSTDKSEGSATLTLQGP